MHDELDKTTAMLDDHGAPLEDIETYTHRSGRSPALLDIYGRPADNMNTFLSEELIDKYNNIFDKAEAVVADNQDLLFRVKIARMPVDYEILDIAYQQKLGVRR